VKPVPRAANGLDAASAERLIELAPEMADVHLDDVRVAVSIRIGVQSSSDLIDWQTR
jgi:hypothetical protein